MCDRAAQDRCVQRLRAREIGHIFAAAPQKPKILDPLNWRADIAVDEAHRLSFWFVSAPAYPYLAGVVGVHCRPNQSFIWPTRRGSTTWTAHGYWQRAKIDPSLAYSLTECPS